MKYNELKAFKELQGKINELQEMVEKLKENNEASMVALKVSYDAIKKDIIEIKEKINAEAK